MSNYKDLSNIPRTHKKCNGKYSQCGGLVKPIEEFRRDGKNRWSPACKSCLAIPILLLKKEKADKLKHATHKSCTKCGIIKSVFEFHKTRKNGISSRNTQCKDCVNAAKRAFTMANADYRMSNRKRCREYYLNNIERATKYASKYRLKYMSDPSKINIILVHSARGTAKDRQLEFNLKPDDFVVGDNCPVCGIEYDYTFVGNKTHNFRRPSLDRFDPTIGYTVDNVWVICWGCNNRKRNNTLEQFKQFVSAMEEHQKNKSNT